MSNRGAYILGLLTLPALVGATWVLLNAVGWFYYRVLARFGITIEVKSGRNIEQLPNSRVLRREIWFEEQRGPTFTGHWCRNEGDRIVATRWFGVGSAHGRCLMILRKRVIR